MVLFDNIICSLDLGEGNEEEYYQTKDLGKGMGCYHISSDGLLYLYTNKSEEEELVKYDFTGNVRFYKLAKHDEPKEDIFEYVATFHHGVIAALVQTSPKVREIPLNRRRALLTELMGLSIRQMEILNELDDLTD